MQIELAQTFTSFFGGLGCTTADPVPVSSGIDPSVVLVGASISVLKPQIRDGRLGAGVQLVQPAVRTKNLPRLLDPEFSFAWGGHFHNMALVAPIERDEELAAAAIDFFLDALEIPVAEVVLRVASRDADLMALCAASHRGAEIEVDRFEERYYRHSIGLPGVVGRNFNVGLRTGDEVADVGNFIVFRDEEGAEFLELGFGDGTILRHLRSLQHVLDSFPFPTVRTEDHWGGRVLEDVSIVSVRLWREGLRPSSRDARTKILAKYLRALYFRAGSLGFDLATLVDLLVEYETRMYGGAEAALEICEYLADASGRIMALLARDLGTVPEQLVPPS